jgi:hypothetical protein
LLCNTIIDRTITDDHYIIFNLNRLNNSYFFIKNRTLYDRKKVHNYKLIINASSVVFNIDEDMQYSSEDLQSKLQNDIANFKDVLGNYIDNYSLTDNKQTTKLKNQEVAKPKVAEPKVAKPKVAKPKVAKPKVAKPEVAEPEVAEPEVAEPEVAKPKVAEPKVAEPKVAESEVAKPKVAEPKVAEPKVAYSEQTKKSKRCPNGTRKNKKTGLCEKI